MNNHVNVYNVDHNGYVHVDCRQSLLHFGITIAQKLLQRLAFHIENFAYINKNFSASIQLQRTLLQYNFQTTSALYYYYYWDTQIVLI